MQETEQEIAGHSLAPMADQVARALSEVDFSFLTVVALLHDQERWLLAKEEREEQEDLDDAEILTQEIQRAKALPVATPARAAAAIPQVS